MSSTRWRWPTQPRSSRLLLLNPRIPMDTTLTITSRILTIIILFLSKSRSPKSLPSLLSQMLLKVSLRMDSSSTMVNSRLNILQTHLTTKLTFQKHLKIIKKIDPMKTRTTSSPHWHLLKIMASKDKEWTCKKSLQKLKLLLQKNITENNRPPPLPLVPRNLK